VLGEEGQGLRAFKEIVEKRREKEEGLKRIEGQSRTKGEVQENGNGQ